MKAPEAIFPTSYFPPIAMAAAMLKQASKSGELTIEQYETFPKQTHRNRTVIATANGPMVLSVPVIKNRGNHTQTKEIYICYNERWNILQWRAIETSYNSSPFFLYYRDEVEKILLKKQETLLQLNEEILIFLFKKMKCNVEIKYTEEYLYPCDDTIDYRDYYSYKHPENLPEIASYPQVFSDRIPFNGNMGILDLLFNIGPETKDYLSLIKV